MFSKNRLTVIVPCYGVEKYLERCMNSLVNQTLRAFEIILVDDESPDHVPEMCDYWVAFSAKKREEDPTFPIIKVIHKKNGGLGMARNSGLEVSTGEYVAFVDSDDFVSLDMYKILLEKAEMTNADVVFCNCSVYKSESDIKPRMDVTEETCFRGRKQVDDFLLDIVGPKASFPHDVKYMMSVWHAVYRRRIFVENAINFVSERELISEDLIFDIDFLPKCNSIVYVPQSLYYYCENGMSLSRKIDPTRYERLKFFDREVLLRLKKIFHERDIMEHFYRMQFLHLRFALEMAARKELGKNLREVLKDEHWKGLLHNFPYSKMDWKHKLYFICCKYRITLALKIFLS